MERFVLLQAFFNVVFLANILYLHRRNREQGRAEVEGSPAPRKVAKGPLVLTLGLGPAPKRKPRPAVAGGIDEGLLDLVSAADRAETRPALRASEPGAGRARAAEELRRSLSRLQQRLEREGQALSS